MHNLVCLVHVASGEGAAVSAGLEALGGAVAPVLEGNFNGGDLAARFVFADEAAYRAARPAIDGVLAGSAVTRADTACFADGTGGGTAPGLAGGIWRGLLLCADRSQDKSLLERFEAELLLMPKYIPAIRNWRLSRVIEATGELPWTHVWEQEFDALDGLMGPYMMHPYHWASVDRWFDPECPDWLVNPHLCHSLAAFGRPLLS
jgi:hypothetical protein